WLRMTTTRVVILNQQHVYTVKPHHAFASAPPVDFTLALFRTRRIASLLRHRQIDRKLRSLTEPLTLRPDRAAMQLDEVPRHSQTQSEPALLARDRSFRLPETIEH